MKSLPSNFKRIYNDTYRVDTVRAAWLNYNHGEYVVTICTKDRKQWFGHIDEEAVPAVMCLSDVGKIVMEEVESIDQSYDGCNVECFVVMPNHVHVMMRVLGGDNDVDSGEEMLDGHYDARRAANARRSKGLVSYVVGTLKSNITKRVRPVCPEFAWQRGFYDNCVRNQEMHNRFAMYIENNVAQWHKDKHYAKWSNR